MTPDIKKRYKKAFGAYCDVCCPHDKILSFLTSELEAQAERLAEEYSKDCDKEIEFRLEAQRKENENRKT